MKADTIKYITMIVPAYLLSVAWFVILNFLLYLLQALPVTHRVDEVSKYVLENEWSRIAITLYLTAWFWMYLNGILRELWYLELHHSDYFKVIIRWIVLACLNLMLPEMETYIMFLTMKISPMHVYIEYIAIGIFFLYRFAQSWAYPDDRINTIKQGLGYGYYNERDYPQNFKEQ